MFEGIHDTHCRARAVADLVQLVPIPMKIRPVHLCPQGQPTRPGPHFMRQNGLAVVGRHAVELARCVTLKRIDRKIRRRQAEVRLMALLLGGGDFDLKGLGQTRLCPRPPFRLHVHIALVKSRFSTPGQSLESVAGDIQEFREDRKLPHCRARTGMQQLVAEGARLCAQHHGRSGVRNRGGDEVDGTAGGLGTVGDLA